MPSSAGKDRCRRRRDRGRYIARSFQERARCRDAVEEALQLLPGDGVFFNDTATTEIYTLSLRDALPIFIQSCAWTTCGMKFMSLQIWSAALLSTPKRSEEHTSELQSHHDLVCRLLL